MYVFLYFLVNYMRVSSASLSSWPGAISKAKAPNELTGQSIIQKQPHRIRIQRHLACHITGAYITCRGSIQGGQISWQRQWANIRSVLQVCSHFPATSMVWDGMGWYGFGSGCQRLRLALYLCLCLGICEILYRHIGFCMYEHICAHISQTYRPKNEESACV